MIWVLTHYSTDSACLIKLGLHSLSLLRRRCQDIPGRCRNQPTCHFQGPRIILRPFSMMHSRSGWKCRPKRRTISSTYKCIRVCGVPDLIFLIISHSFQVDSSIAFISPLSCFHHIVSNPSKIALSLLAFKSSRFCRDYMAHMTRGFHSEDICIMSKFLFQYTPNVGRFHFNKTILVRHVGRHARFQVRLLIHIPPQRGRFRTVPPTGTFERPGIVFASFLSFCFSLPTRGAAAQHCTHTWCTISATCLCNSPYLCN